MSYVVTDIVLVGSSYGRPTLTVFSSLLESSVNGRSKCELRCY